MQEDGRNDDEKLNEPGSGFSRRDFLKVGGISLSVPLVVNPRTLRIGGEDVKVYGPGKVPISLNINAKKYAADVEPRTTLLDTLRNELELTGAKRVCDRASCGACTVIVDGKAVRTRPLCAYPAVATYTGAGSTDEASHFICK